MRQVIFTEQADEDLFNIYVYSHETWGEQQALIYVQKLKDGISKIAENPNWPGTVDRSSLRSGYRSYHVQRHLIFYRLMDEHLEIIRILHERMDVKSRLND